jgi:hypothetical protein
MHSTNLRQEVQAGQIFIVCILASVGVVAYEKYSIHGAPRDNLASNCARAHIVRLDE